MNRKLFSEQENTAGGISEKEFLDKLFNRENFAYKYLHRSLFYPMLHVASSYTKNDVISEELIQDVFLVLLERKQRFETLNHVKYFLYLTLKNKCIDYLRKQKVEETYIREAFSVLHNIDEDFWDKLFEEEIFAALMNALNSLSPQCKTVMLLTLENKKIAEIAELMQISTETVKDYRRVSKKKLKEYFEKMIIHEVS